MNFAQLNLHPILVRNLALMGYDEPRPIQAQAMGPILDRRDVIGLAQTGTGKTAAFIVPIAHHLISAKPPQRKGKPIEAMTRLRALVLCPTRELAQQVAEEAAAIVQGSVLRALCAYGKVAISPQAKAIARGVDILIGTPGRVRELLEAGALSLAHVKHVAIDEADRMLDMGFLPQVSQILQAIPTFQSEPRQTLLFTATMPPEVEELAGQFLNNPIRIEVGRHTTPVEHVKQHLLPVDDDDKMTLVLHLIEHDKRRGVLIFCRTRRRVGWVGTALARNNISVGMIHGDRSQAQRQKALVRFSNDELRVLVATDVAARGLHIPAVKNVVNYDMPITPEEYVHRIGRAAHGGGFGEAFTFLSPRGRDETLRWRAILNTTGVDVHAETLEGFEPSKNVTPRKGGRAISPIDRQDGGDEESRRAEKRRRLRQTRRSKKGRPIKPGQKPGKGVVSSRPRGVS